MSESEYYDIIEAKTALLFGFSLYLGAYSVGADETHALQLKEAGIAIGMAFPNKRRFKRLQPATQRKRFCKRHQRTHYYTSAHSCFEKNEYRRQQRTYSLIQKPQ